VLPRVTKEVYKKSKSGAFGFFAASAVAYATELFCAQARATKKDETSERKSMMMKGA
jgi:hypothetical protein